MDRRDVTLAISLVALLLVQVVGVKAEDSLAAAQKNGISFGFSNEPPFAFLSPDSKPAGVNSEVLVAVMHKIGIKEVRPVVAEWASLIPGLKSRRFDVATSMFILPARCTQVAFSDPASKTESAMLVRAGNPKELHSYDDVSKRADVTLAVMSGAAEQNYARRAGIPGARILPLQDPAALLSAVKTGRADAAALTPGSVHSMTEKGDGDVEAAKPFITPSWAIAYSAYPFRREDESLREAFNKGLKAFLGSQEWKTISAKYGRDEEALPGAASVDALCRPSE